VAGAIARPWLIFHEGLDLPAFAAFDLLTLGGRDRLRRG
jgi:hypothetical protein